jgi:galactofuranosylgalactofuranosylrhamnosyl-N-acetylglucosaminyl-diphospho-decaprenol beta-1,5/1,6-galactofuranosyltransferase
MEGVVQVDQRAGRDDDEAIALSPQGESPVALDGAARADAVRQGAADSKIAGSSSLRVGGENERIDPRRVLQRVIMPRADDPLEVRPLYLDESDTVGGRTADVLSRRSITVPQSTQISFASYFNAFPASYWKRWTRVEEVALRVTVAGAGRVDLYRSKPNGDIVHLQGKQLDTETEAGTPATTEVEFRVSLAPFEDGGWVWFDVATRHGALTVTDAAWIVDTPLPLRRLAVAITTFNRPGDCVAALGALAEDEAVLDVVSTVFVVDQGSVKIRDHQDYPAVADRLGARLVVIDQENLGGSGGFARGMLEALTGTDVEQVLLMDDDVRLEPDSVLRAHAFASAVSSPVIVGSQMLNLQARSHLLAMGEIVDLETTFWRPAPGSVYDHDFAKLTLRHQRLLHARIDSTYNGWWMCLLPREVLEQVGLPLPLFIKWDDAEYALRAAEHGFPTVTLPGSAIWHMPWADKNDSSDWTAYFHLRNRLITMALHSKHDVRRALVTDGFRNTFKSLMAMEYSTVALHLKAIEDFLAGPHLLFDSLRDGLPAVQQIRKGYDDARMVSSAQELPTPLFDPVRIERLLEPPVHPVAIAKRALSTVSRHLRAPDPAAKERPQINVPARNARWFLLGTLDSATVSNADGSGVAFRRRDPQQFRSLLAHTVALYRRLVADWVPTAKRYRAAVPQLSSAEAWRAAFGQRSDKR